MSQLPYLNLGCGRIILPAPKPEHHVLVPDGVHDYALWHNVDRNPQPGVDEVADVFRYPFPWADNSFDGALLTHLCEHIPHEIRHRVTYQRNDDNGLHYVSPQEAWSDRYQDGWFAFFAELHRVLTPNSLIHVLSPYAWSDGAVNDPTHTRLLTPSSFQHSMQPDPDAPFAYATGGLHLVMEDPPRVNLTPDFQYLVGKRELFERALSTQINVVYEFYVCLRVVK